MRGLSASDIVDLWEQGRGLGNASRALAILASADPEIAMDGLMALRVGQRDAMLLDVRARTFGTELEAVAICPACGALVGVTLSTGDLAPLEEAVPRLAEPVERALCNRQMMLRPVTAADLVAVEREPDVEASRQALLRRCVLLSDRDPDLELTAELAKAVEEALEALDNGALTELMTSCPACKRGVAMPFDAATFLWEEIVSHARKILYDVSALAQRYHWSEGEILSMSAARRQFYLRIPEA